MKTQTNPCTKVASLLGATFRFACQLPHQARLWAWLGLLILTPLLQSPTQAAVAAATSTISVDCADVTYPTELTIFTCGPLDFAYPISLVQKCPGTPPVSVVCTPLPSALPIGTTLVQCRIISNNQVIGTFKFFVTVIKDTTPPQITCPPNIEVVGCMDPTGLCGAFIPQPPITATDDSGNVVTSCNWPANNFFPCGTTTIICSAFDRCQNTAKCTFTVTVKPGKAPTIKCPPSELIVTACPNANNQGILNYPAPTVDPADATVVCTPPPGSLQPFGPVTITCTASNACGIVKCQFVVILRPVPPPTIICPNGQLLTMIIPCSSNCIPVKYPLPTVTGGTLAFCKPAIGDCLPAGDHVIICAATNECGTRAVCEFLVRIIKEVGEPPIIKCPQHLEIITCDPCAKITLPNPTVINGALAGCTLASGAPIPDCFKPGNYLIICTATNGCSASRCEFTLSVKAQLAVQITCPNDITVETCDPCAKVLFPLPIVLNGALESCSPASGDCFKPGTNLVTCVATNGCSKDVCRFNVIVKRKAPAAIRCPQDIVVTTCEPCAVVTYPAPIVVGGALVGCLPPSGSCFPKGVTIVNCFATNDCGVKSECKFTVTVRDGIVDPIRIICPQNIIVETCDPCAKVTYPAPTVVNGTLAKCDPPSGFCFPPGLNIVHCYATNKCGQVAECKFTVVVRRTGPPVIHCPDNLVLETCGNCAPLHFPAPVILNGALAGCNPPLGTCLPIGVHTVVCVATNACGKTECKFTVTVKKNRPLEIKCPEDIIIRTCGEGETVSYPRPIVFGSDDPTAYGLTCTPPPGSFFPVGTNIVKCCVRDRCQDQIHCCTFKIIVVKGQSCVKPPSNMVLWLPLDEPVGIVANNIIAGAPNGFHIGGPVPLLGQKVLNSLGFDGANDFVTVPNYAGIMLNNTDLSIDAWVLRRDQEGRRVIVSKVGPRSLAGANLPRGYEFYLRNGLMHLWLGGTAITDYSSGVLVPNDNKWHHVAVTVARSAGGLVRFYLDGAVAASQAGAVVAPLANNSRLNVGASTFPGVADFWRGYLDEVEIFDRELAPSEVYGLFKADSAGKCKIRCVVPWDRHYPADGSPVLAQVFFCNDSGVTQTLTYVPEGPMNISGPGTITLLPGECNNVWIRIDRPTNNAPIGSVVVWTLTVYPNFGCPFVCKGSVINPGPIHVTGPDGVVGIPGGRPGNIALGLNGLPPGTPITIRVVGPDMEPDLRVISLNGLPPGVPWLITPGVVTPAADDMTLNIPVRFVEGNAVDNYTILLDADLDGDGQFVTLRSIDVSNPVVAPPTLSITNTADGSVIKWNDDGDGVLEVSESLDGPWKSVPGARSGYINKNAGKQLFFRVTVQIAE